jgi:hypothetical protein
LAQRIGVAGHAWVFLNWLVGLRSLGFDVTFVDRLEPEMQVRPDHPAERSAEWRWLRDVMGAGALEDSVALLVDSGRTSIGLDRTQLLDRCRRADVLFNVMGYLDDDELLAAVAGPRVFVDIDPGFPQMWRALGLCDLFAGHDAFVTVGLAVGTPESAVPTCGLRWITTPPPVAFELWPAVPRVGPRDVLRITEVASWRGPNGPVEFEGVTYGLRAHELRRYASLPQQVPGASLEIALDIDPPDAADVSLLRKGGWKVENPRRLVPSLDDYRRYLADSDLEFSVAKQMYVRSRGGWFSDRSACYLATGRPVVAQNTGYAAHLPTGEGLMAFSDPPQARAALEDVSRDIVRHSDAARKVAEEQFDARTVLRRLIEQVGVP